MAKTLLEFASETEFYECFQEFMKGKIDHDELCKLVETKMSENDEHAALLADVVSLIDMETSVKSGSTTVGGGGGDKKLRDRFTSALHHLSRIIGSSLLKQSVDLDSLSKVTSLDISKDEFNKRYVRLKTRLYYKQQKYNLLREENEGYAKLIVELNQDFADDDGEEEEPDEAASPVVMALVETIKALIGSFDLDPNRVLDLILEAFEYRPRYQRVYVAAIRHFAYSLDTVAQMLGFKFNAYKNEETPTSLFRVTALILKEKIVNIENIWTHLVPTDDFIVESYKAEIAKGKEYARRLTTLNLADKPEGAEKDRERIETLELMASAQAYNNNQKQGLLEGCLLVGDWDTALRIIHHLPEYYASSCPSTALAFCHLVEFVIDPLYKKYHGLPAGILKLPVSLPIQPQIKQVTVFEDLPETVFPILRSLGPYIAMDYVLYGKICRILRSFLLQYKVKKISEESYLKVIPGALSVLDEVIIPGLSMTFANCCLSETLWSVLSLLPYQDRYLLYGRWKSKTLYDHPRLIRAKAEILEKSKYIMKRLTKDNTKQTGRQLGKLSHCFPTVVFDYVLLQLQRYDNLITPVVDAMKYLSSLSFDVLIYCLIDALASSPSGKNKYDETTIALWMQSLATFTGMLCKKYTFDIHGLLQYVANQLKVGKSVDLLVLREVLQKMAGIEITEAITDDQLNCMTGGELLKQEGGYYLQVRNTKRSSSRLKESLAEVGLTFPFTLLMAQERDNLVYGKDSQHIHLKLVGQLFDNCQNTLLQLGSFISLYLSNDEFSSKLPAIDQLLSKYGLSADAAFFISRQMYSQQITAKFEVLQRKQDEVANTSCSSSTDDDDADIAADGEKHQRFADAVSEVIGSIIDLIHPIATKIKSIPTDISINFFVTFWLLSANDLIVPYDAYKQQIDNLQQQIRHAEESPELTANKKKKEKERCSGLIDKLKSEMDRQEERVERVTEYIKRYKDSWFEKGNIKSEIVIQQCIMPRACFSSVDAVYASHFILLLHQLRAKNFGTLLFYDKIFLDITCFVSQLTENEAHRYGRFLGAALDILMRWHSSKDIFDAECEKTPGFITVIRRSMAPGTTGAAASSTTSPEHLDYENYRNVCHKWHFKLTKALVNCLKSENYIQIRNAIIVLTKIINSYPKVKAYGKVIENRVDDIVKGEKDKRPDIYTLALSYSGQLKSRKHNWVAEPDFHIAKQKKVVAASSSSAAAASASVSSPGAAPQTDGHKSISKAPTTAAIAGAVATATGGGVSEKPVDPRKAKNKDVKRVESTTTSATHPSSSPERASSKSKLVEAVKESAHRHSPLTHTSEVATAEPESKRSKHGERSTSERKRTTAKDDVSSSPSLSIAVPSEKRVKATLPEIAEDGRERGGGGSTRPHGTSHVRGNKKK